MIRTLGIIGDVHTEHERLERALAHLQTLSPDKILCVGDLVDGPGDVVRCCELLQQYKVDTVAGNHERWFFSQSQSFRQGLPEHTPKWSIEADSYAFLRSLPKVRVYQSIAGQIMLCHGLDDDDMASVGPDDYGYALESNDVFQRLLAEQEHPIIINGHTHKMMAKSFNKTMMIINAGTLYRDHQPGFLFVDLVQREVQFYRFDQDLHISLEKKVSWDSSQ
jgi:predicted phosphodiesterase